MVLFSERYGYTKPSDVLIREQMPEEIVNGICSCYDLLYKMLNKIDGYDSFGETYGNMELYLWTHFLNKRHADFYSHGGHAIVATNIIKDAKQPWYKRLDMVEMTLKWLISGIEDVRRLETVVLNFVNLINHEFERHNYAYRIVDKEIVELTNEQEILAIENCLAVSTNNVRKHLSEALELLAEKPTGKYGSSIQNSISAVEVVCRNLTGENTLGRALDCLIKKGVVIPQSLKNAFNKLYDYTNDKETGIRHALMDETAENAPSYAEALFMLVSCSAFINYLYAKESKLLND